jgi:putative ABC transport system substrate-binding protein
VQRLQELGWTDGRNVRIDHRWGLGEADRLREYAAELVALSPDVILAGGPPAVAALQQVTRTLPIVFANVTDPVGLDQRFQDLNHIRRPFRAYRSNYEPRGQH